MSSDWPAKSHHLIGWYSHRTSITLKPCFFRKFKIFIFEIRKKINLDIFEIFAAQVFVVSKMEYFLSYLFSWRAYAELDINCVNNYYENLTIFIILFNGFNATLISWYFTYAPAVFD